MYDKASTLHAFRRKQCIRCDFVFFPETYIRKIRSSENGTPHYAQRPALQIIQLLNRLLYCFAFAFIRIRLYFRIKSVAGITADKRGIPFHGQTVQSFHILLRNQIIRIRKHEICTVHMFQSIIACPGNTAVGKIKYPEPCIPFGIFPAYIQTMIS